MENGGVHAPPLFLSPHPFGFGLLFSLDENFYMLLRYCPPTSYSAELI